MKPRISELGAVEYSKLIPALGILAGLALTFVFPIVVLKVLAGPGVTDGVTGGMMIIGVSGGVLIILFSTVFGIALPGRVSGADPDRGDEGPVAAPDADGS